MRTCLPPCMCARATSQELAPVPGHRLNFTPGARRVRVRHLAGHDRRRDRPVHGRLGGHGRPEHAVALQAQVRVLGRLAVAEEGAELQLHVDHRGLARRRLPLDRRPARGCRAHARALGGCSGRRSLARRTPPTAQQRPHSQGRRHMQARSAHSAWPPRRALARPRLPPDQQRALAPQRLAARPPAKGSATVALRVPRGALLALTCWLAQSGLTPAAISATSSRAGRGARGLEDAGREGVLGHRPAVQQHHHLRGPRRQLSGVHRPRSLLQPLLFACPITFNCQAMAGCVFNHSMHAPEEAPIWSLPACFG